MELTHLRRELAFDGSIALPGGAAEVTTICSGTGPLVDPDEERLSEIIARISIDPSSFPVYERRGDDQAFWLRTPTSTVEVRDQDERDRIIARRWRIDI